MKTRVIKKVGSELHILEDGKRYVGGLGHFAEVDKKREVVDLIDFVSPSLLRRPAPILEKYKDLNDGESLEEIIDEDPGKDFRH